MYQFQLNDSRLGEVRIPCTGEYSFHNISEDRVFGSGDIVFRSDGNKNLPSVQVIYRKHMGQDLEDFFTEVPVFVVNDQGKTVEVIRP